MIEITHVILPISTLIIFALLTIPVYNLIRKSNHKMEFTLGWFIAIFVITGVMVANLAISYYSTSSPGIISLGLNADESSIFSSAFLVDTVSIYMGIIVVALSAVVLIYGIFYIDSSEKPVERYFAIMLMTTAGIFGAAFAGDLLTLFIFWEIATAGTTVLMLFKKNIFSINATLKYLIMIVIASAFVVFGMSIIYGLTGTLNYLAISQILSALSSNQLLVFAFIFIAAGYAIEAAIVPFHFWLPDAYTAAPASSASFLSALVDQGSYYILIRVLLYVLLPSIIDWTVMLAAMAALTMIVGNLFALIQNNVKRLMTYICIADIGYNLVAISSVTALGLMGNLYFFLIGGITTALGFMTVGVMNSHGFKSLEDFSGLGKKMPLVSIALVMAGLSFSGVPPFGGFIAKYLVFTAAIEANLSWLAVIGVLTSVLQTAYLLRLILIMYGKTPLNQNSIKESKRILIPIFILAGTLIVVGLFPNIILDLIHPAIEQLKTIIPNLPTI